MNRFALFKRMLDLFDWLEIVLENRSDNYSLDGLILDPFQLGQLSLSKWLLEHLDPLERLLDVALKKRRDGDDFAWCGIPFRQVLGDRFIEIEGLQLDLEIAYRRGMHLPQQTLYRPFASEGNSMLANG